MTDQAARPSKEARLKQILSVLTPRERDALHRYYTLLQEPWQISRDLNMNPSELKALRSRVRKEFLGARWSQ